ncbi:hypothetical protein [Kribbella sp. NBC_00359]|uniref:hypothetical protein n=1 Tax=Kribbella sp. NBC_00359 TaxID=2975966 RepID=UPI002E213A85
MAREFQDLRIRQPGHGAQLSAGLTVACPPPQGVGAVGAPCSPPIPLSQWAEQNGIPRRTAYNWAKNGKLPVPFHRTITGRVMVLTDDEDQDQGDRLHPFSQLYAEALNLPGDLYDGATYCSPVLDAWGRDLYDSVDPDLRPPALNVAIPAACNRPKRDLFFRLADWLGRVEPAAWYSETGFLRARGCCATAGHQGRRQLPARLADGAHSFEWRESWTTSWRSTPSRAPRGTTTPSPRSRRWPSSD